MYVFFDLESRSNDRAPAYYAKKVYEAPSNYVDPVKIAKAIEEKRAADSSKAGLTWWTGAVCCITAQTDRGDKFSMVGDDEVTILRGFFDWCRKIEADGETYLLSKWLAVQLSRLDFYLHTRPLTTCIFLNLQINCI